MFDNSFYEMAVKSRAMGDYYLKMVIGVIVTVFGVLAFPYIGAIALIIVVIGLYIVITYAQDKNVEYEYTFTDSSVEIAAIMNASKRKEVFSFDMEQVTMIVPLGSKRIENESFSKKRDYSSAKREDQVYCFVVENDKQKQLVMLEPDEKALKHIKTYGRNKMYND
ncbi:MAG: hypothetical protein E7264_02560 [Lachnospiraceae bacterium]|nr:hypothetical protein [Lachnospiraceae bacterium]